MTTSSFDPEQIAAQAAEHGEDPLAVVVGQYGGFLSACWENLAGAGVFESTRAAAATEAVLGWLRSPVPGSTHRLAAEDRLLLFGPDLNMDDAGFLTGWLTGGVDRVAIASGITGAVVVAGPERRLESEPGDGEQQPAAREPVAGAADALRLAGGVGLDELDGRLVESLRQLGDEFGPLGVLSAAGTVWEAERDAAAASGDGLTAPVTRRGEQNRAAVARYRARKAG